MNVICSSRQPLFGIQKRSAFTMIELLVVIAIIGLLIALIVPAVMSARASAHRLECQNRMRQWGVALHGYESSHKSLPFGYDLDGQGMPLQPQWTSAQVRCLPYLEQTAAYDEIMAAKSRTPSNRAMKFEFAVFHCPMDDVGTGLNYRTCTGGGFLDSLPTKSALRLREAGIFPASRNGGGPKLADVGDGLSNTAAMSERLIGRGFSGRYDRKRDIWYSGAAALGFNVSSGSVDSATGICRNAPVDPSPFYKPFAGTNYAQYGLDYTWYNHALPPNSDIPDCSLNSISVEDPSQTNVAGTMANALVSARSEHRDRTVSLLLMDGSVRLIPQSVDTAAWRALATSNGQDAGLE